MSITVSIYKIVIRQFISVALLLISWRSWLSSAKFLATWKRTIVHKLCNITVLSCTKKTVVLIKNSSENSCPSSINGMQRARNEFWGEVTPWQKKQYWQDRGRSCCHQRGSDIVTSKCRLSASSNRYTDVYLLLSVGQPVSLFNSDFRERVSWILKYSSDQWNSCLAVNLLPRRLNGHLAITVAWNSLNSLAWWCFWLRLWCHLKQRRLH